jgi:hypothetical protein
MKKIFLSLALAVAVFSGIQAQTTGAVVTTIPANFTAVDNVKVIVDVSAVANLANKEPLYIWTWFPIEPSPGNGDWGNSNEARKMVKEGPNKWSWTMKPADYYGSTIGGVFTPMKPADLTVIRFLVKAKDGTGDFKTADIELKIAPLVFTPTDFRTFPSVAGKDELMRVYLDQTLVKNDDATQRMTPVTAEVTLYNGNNQVGTVLTKSLQANGNKLFSFYVFPRGDFNVPSGTPITKMKVVYKGTMLDTGGAVINVSSQPYEKLFDELK